MAKKNAPSLTDFVVWNPSAPSLTDLNLDLIASVVAAKNKVRNDGIAALKSSGKEHIVACMMWDHNAPPTTNLKQLQEVGITVPKPDSDLGDEEVTRNLWLVINGLAVLGVYFTGTNHLSDRQFYNLLVGRILLEQVSDIPPNADMSEFIDLTPCNRDEEDDSIALPPDSDLGRDSLLPRPNRQLQMQMHSA
jgi:hypothetical protein